MKTTHLISRKIRNRLQIDEFLIYILFDIFSVNQFETHDDAKHNYFFFLKHDAVVIRSMDQPSFPILCTNVLPQYMLLVEV